MTITGWLIAWKCLVKRGYYQYQFTRLLTDQLRAKRKMYWLIISVTAVCATIFLTRGTAIDETTHIQWSSSFAGVVVCSNLRVFSESRWHMGKKARSGSFAQHTIDGKIDEWNCATTGRSMVNEWMWTAATTSMSSGLCGNLWQFQ